MKKSLILILFTFVCFITFTSEVFAEEKCYWCADKNRMNGYLIWSEKAPNCFDGINRTLPYVSKESCTGSDMSFDEAKKKNEQQQIANSGTVSLPNPGFGSEMSCSELLGPSLTKLVSILLDVFKFAAMILCTIQMMMALIPPITNKDSDALNKALKKCVTLAIIFVCALLIDTFVVIIGRLFGFDLSCFR